MIFLQYGAGNIGRSFIGALFARAGYEVVFVEVNPLVLEALNRDRRYKVEIHDDPPSEFWVENVRAVDGREAEAVAREIAAADIMGTAVGPNILPRIYPVIARGLIQRLGQGRPALDIIIAENLRHAAAALAAGLRENLPPDFPLDSYVGLIETSIGKMVPIMPEAIVRTDSTLVYAEAYNTLILDKKGFRNRIPDVPGFDPKDNMEAYVDRKLFVHNLGHAAGAYLGFCKSPEKKFIWEMIGDGEIREKVRGAMQESAQALLRRYPGEFTPESLGDHIDDLLRRFSNRALGDTVFRIGRDLPRKLSREDRLIGALLLDDAMLVEAPLTAQAAAAAFSFGATDEAGKLFPADAAFQEALAAKGMDFMLKEVCGLEAGKAADGRVMAAIKASLRV
jgi:mannitol-1-phosphate 5-dehydrogenase